GSSCVSPFNLRYQPCLVDVGERYRVRALGGLELQHARIDATQDALDPSGVPDRLAPLELSFLAPKADIIRLLLERPIQPRRRDFQPLVSYTFYRKEVREMIAHARAVLDIDAAGLVDEHAHEPSAGRRLAVDQLVPHRGQRALQQLTQL